MVLTDVEVRVLGALMEKEATTPEAYPLSTQALATACNQKTSRDPVTDLHLQEVEEAVRRARDRGLVATVRGAGGRVPKHRHRMREALDLNREEAALLSVLMLRGPQTPGELRARIARYVGDVDADDVARHLEAVADRPAPLVRDLGRGPGQSQNRWTHALAAGEERLRPRVRDEGRPRDPAATGRGVEVDAGDDVQDVGRPSLEERVAALERRVAELEAALGPAVDATDATPDA